MREIFLKLAPLAVVLSILAAMFGGCSPVADTKTVMLDYLKQKYGEEFVVQSFTGPNWGQGYYAISANPVGKEDQIISVHGNKNKEGKFVCHDNYFEYIIQDEYEKAMSDIVRQYFTEFKLYMIVGGSGMCADRLNYGSKIEDIYREDEIFSTNLLAFVKLADTDKKDLNSILEKIALDMIEKKLVGQIRIYPTYDDKFTFVNRENINDVLNNREQWCKPYEIIGVSRQLEIVRYKKY